MKNLIIAAISSIYVLSSCIAECDTSTVQAAATCLCEVGDEILMNSDDKEKVKDLLEKHSAYIKEIEQAYADGKYTKNEIDAVLKDRNCDL